jgi:hypothetical protein
MLKELSQIYYHYHQEISTAGKSLVALIVALIPYEFIRDLFTHPPSETVVKWCQLILILVTIFNIIYNINKKK